jgi:hypothetical protein
VSPAGSQQLPHATTGGYELPNGWRLTPPGRAIQTEDMVLNVSIAPDRKAVVALHSAFNPLVWCLSMRARRKPCSVFR